jgi:hypothetical protein
VRYDPRPALGRLASGESIAWEELWQELYHQGDVGTASYASVPELTTLERDRVTPEWNTYALVASIELARSSGSNPPIPDWLERTYDDALAALAADATMKLPIATSNEDVRSMLSIIAISKRLRRHAEVLLDFSEEELEDVLGDVLGHG